MCRGGAGSGWGSGVVGYHALRERLWDPPRPGDASGGDATRMPVDGLTIGMALRWREGTGAWNLSMLAWNIFAYGDACGYARGAGCTWCCRGED